MKKSSFYHPPLHSTPPLGGFPSEYRHPFWYWKSRTREWAPREALFVKLLWPLVAVSGKCIPEWLSISNSLQDWRLVYWETACLVWSPESCVTAARCSCAHVVHWKVKVTSSLTDVWQQLFEQQGRHMLLETINRKWCVCAIELCHYLWPWSTFKVISAILP